MHHWCQLGPCKSCRGDGFKYQLQAGINVAAYQKQVLHSALSDEWVFWALFQISRILQTSGLSLRFFDLLKLGSTSSARFDLSLRDGLSLAYLIFEARRPFEACCPLALQWHELAGAPSFHHGVLSCQQLSTCLRLHHRSCPSRDNTAARPFAF